MNKLFIVSRLDLDPGAVAAQSCHALDLFATQHEHKHLEWRRNHKNLVLLQVRNEQELWDLEFKARKAGYATALFREPDFADAATALALEPDAWKLVSSLPLALRSVHKQAARLTRDEPQQAEVELPA
jgi:peptidyl-tRNA hydrolase